MKYQEYIANILAGKIAPVYLFYGNEYYLIEDGVSKIVSKFVPKGSENFNRDIFYGDDADGAKIVNTALSIPMMAQKRVVIVKNFNKLQTHGKELILKYCKHPAKETVLLLVADEIDFRNKLYAELKKVVAWVECKTLYDNQIYAFIQQYVRDKGKRIRPQAIQLLQARLGNSMRDIVNEMEKLIQYTSNKSEISSEDVEQLVGISRSFNIFQLWDALGEKNLSKSIFIMRQMIETGEMPVFIVSSLTTYFIRLWRIRALKRNRKSDAEIGKILRIHSFFVKSSIQQAMRYSDQELKTIMQLLLLADVDLKTSYQKPVIVLELLIYGIISNQKKLLAQKQKNKLIG